MTTTSWGTDHDRRVTSTAANTRMKTAEEVLQDKIDAEKKNYQESSSDEEDVEDLDNRPTLPQNTYELSKPLQIDPEEEQGDQEGSGSEDDGSEDSNEEEGEGEGTDSDEEDEEETKQEDQNVDLLEMDGEPVE